MNLGILAAEFNRPLVEAMVAGARDEAAGAGARIVCEVRVPGCYETVLVADRMLARRDVDAIVVLGYIERGETQHGEVMGHVVHRALVDLELVYGKPIGVGVIGPGATPEQAEVRKDGYARAAVRAALRSAAALVEIAKGAAEAEEEAEADARSGAAYGSAAASAKAKPRPVAKAKSRSKGKAGAARAPKTARVSERFAPKLPPRSRPR
jgi:6,7-dimethyl-8-ribityllumazine synthase